MTILFIDQLWNVQVNPDHHCLVSADYKTKTFIFNFEKAPQAQRDPFRILWHSLMCTYEDIVKKIAQAQKADVQPLSLQQLGIAIAEALRENPDLRSPDAFKRAIHKHAKG